MFQEVEARFETQQQIEDEDEGPVEGKVKGETHEKMLDDEIKAAFQQKMMDDVAEEIKLDAEAAKDVGGQIRDLFLSGYAVNDVMEALGLTEDEVNEHQGVRKVDVQFDENVVSMMVLFIVVTHVFLLKLSCNMIQDAGFESQEGVQIPVEPPPS
ncbi:hypothetical protein LXL04_036353 [Taraxacum kok-saghyz]